MFLAVSYILWVSVFSLVAFLTYGWDKRMARLDRRRVPEKTLHWLGLLGGWPGAIYAQRRFHHKTRKLSFQLAFWGCVVLHLAILAAVIYIVYLR